MVSSSGVASVWNRRSVGAFGAWWRMCGTGTKHEEKWLHGQTEGLCVGTPCHDAGAGRPTVVPNGACHYRALHFSMTITLVCHDKSAFPHEQPCVGAGLRHWSSSNVPVRNARNGWLPNSSAGAQGHPWEGFHGRVSVDPECLGCIRWASGRRRGYYPGIATRKRTGERDRGKGRKWASGRRQARDSSPSCPRERNVASKARITASGVLLQTCPGGQVSS